MCCSGENITEINLGVKMIQSEKGFLFGTDALLLAAFARRDNKAEAADFGCGPGAVSLLCAAAGKYKHITSFEVQKSYADLCARNATINGFEEKITVENRDIRNIKRKFKVIMSNPPYMKADAGKLNEDDGKRMARHEINGGICDFCRAVSVNLEFGGTFYSVYRPDRLTEFLYALHENKLEAKRICFVHSDPLHAPCLVLTEAKLGGKPSLNIIPPLFLNDENGVMTERTEKIYQDLEFV